MARATRMAPPHPGRARSPRADAGGLGARIIAAPALAIGSIGGAVVVALAGFETAILATLIRTAGGAIVAGRDAALRAEPPARPSGIVIETA